jgi:hypothetical protein
VIDVTVRDPHDAGSSIPDHHREFFLRIPEWIRRHVLLLEGHLILEQIIRTKVREESFQNQPVRTGIDEETLPIVRREVVFDPALILGHFVLTGWTEREQKPALPGSGTPDSKLPSDSTVDRRRAGEQFVSLWPVAIGVTVASAVMMFFSRTQPALMIPAALLLAFVAGGLLIRCLHQKCYWKKGSIDLLFMGFGSLAVFAGLVGLQGVSVFTVISRFFNSASGNDVRGFCEVPLENRAQPNGGLTCYVRTSFSRDCRQNFNRRTPRGKGCRSRSVSTDAFVVVWNQRPVVRLPDLRRRTITGFRERVCSNSVATANRAAGDPQKSARRSAASDAAQRHISLCKFRICVVERTSPYRIGTSSRKRGKPACRCAIAGCNTERQTASKC